MATTLKKLSCPYCNFSNQDLQDFGDHIKSLHLESLGALAPGTCFVCKARVKNVRNHVKMAHMSLSEKKDRCPHCLERVWSLEQHLLKGLKKSSLTCGICQVIVKKKACLEKHVLRMHGKPVEKCETCGKAYEGKCEFCTEESNALVKLDNPEPNKMILETASQVEEIVNEEMDKSQVESISLNSPEQSSSKSVQEKKEGEEEEKNETTTPLRGLKSSQKPWLKLTFSEKRTTKSNESKKRRASEPIVNVRKQRKLSVESKKVPTKGTCPYCDTNKAQLKIHLCAIGQNVHNCKHCDFDTFNQNCFDDHVQKVHEKEDVEIITCTLCNIDFIKQENLDFHTKLRHSDTNEEPQRDEIAKELDEVEVTDIVKWNTCGMCDFKTQDDILDDHILANHTCTVCTGIRQEKSDLCQGCDKEFNPQIQVKKLEKCPYCHNLESDLRSHLKGEKNSKSKKCTKCPFSSANVKCLKRHQLEIHEIDKGVLFCDECAVSFSCKASLALHVKLANHGPTKIAENPNSKCDICLQEFADKMALKRHTKSQKKHFQCHQCGVQAPQQACLTHHLSVVHGEDSKVGLLESVNN